MTAGKKIIIAPLDWGLGHATRCIPLIRAFTERNCEVTIICSGRSLALLQEEFPQLKFIDLPAYNIYYQKKGSFVWKIILQLQKIFRGIKHEHKALQEIAAGIKPDIIISDNRYGMWHRDVHSILITHQIMVKMPSIRFAEPLVHWWLMRNHRKFDTVWIPDVEGSPNISGDLSHKYKLPAYIKFIGVLTRFAQPEKLPPQEYDVLVILSGPEPQRSIFEKMILEEAPQTNKKIVIISGRSEVHTDEYVNENIRLISYCTATEIFQLILRSEVIISRGGYSTLMDLAHLHKKCIFIPTPGQTEQEYLVDALQREELIYTCSQENFNLQHALDEVRKTKGFFIDADRMQYLRIIDDLLRS